MPLDPELNKPGVSKLSKALNFKLEAKVSLYSLTIILKLNDRIGASSG